MWTTDGIHTLPGMSENFQPNYFVPLVEFVAKNVLKKKLQPKITDLFRSDSLQNDQSTSESKLMRQMMFHIQCNYVISAAIMHHSAGEGARQDYTLYGMFILLLHDSLISQHDYTYQ